MPPPIKILHVLHAFNIGGLENGLVNIINGSPDHLIHELCVLADGVEFLKKLNRPVTYHELHRSQGNDPRLVMRLHKILKWTRPQIVHTRNWAAFDGVLAACLSPGIVLLHGEHGREIENPLGLIKRRNLALRIFAFRIRKFIAVSADIHRWLLKIVRVPGKKLIFIPNGVDTARYRPSRSPWLRQQLGIAQDEFVVGSVGRLDPVKNHEGLIRAVQVLNRQGAKVRLVIVGDGPNRLQLENLLQRVNFTPRPILTGNRTDLESYYGLFEVFVQNSFAEGMSNTLLEAMASGLPVICTPVGGNVELITDEVNGKHVPVGDDASLAEKIRDYQSFAELRRRHGNNARDLAVNNFSLRIMVERYIRLYETTP